MVSLRVNGTSRSFDGDDDMPLLWYLRDELRLTGTRFGCGAGLCRSEEHTSELQSLRHLVCRLLLEKKNDCDRARRMREQHEGTNPHRPLRRAQTARQCAQNEP